MGTIGSGGRGLPPNKKINGPKANTPKAIIKKQINPKKPDKTQEKSRFFQTNTSIDKPKTKLNEFKYQLPHEMMKQAVEMGKAEIKEHKTIFRVCKEQLIEYQQSENKSDFQKVVKIFITVKSNEIQTANVIMSPDCCGVVILRTVTELKDDILSELMKPEGLPSHESSDKLIQILKNQSIANEEAAKLLKELMEMAPQVRELGNEIKRVSITVKQTN